MPNKNSSVLFKQITELDPSIFDDDGGLLQFSCEDCSMIIRTLGSGRVEIERQEVGATTHIGPCSLEDAHKMFVPIMYPQAYAVLSMIVDLYERHACNEGGLKAPAYPRGRAIAAPVL